MAKSLINCIHNHNGYSMVQQADRTKIETHINRKKRIQLFNATTRMCVERFMQEKTIQILLNYMVSDVKIISHMNEKLCIPSTILRVGQQCANCAHFGYLCS